MCIYIPYGTVRTSCRMYKKKNAYTGPASQWARASRYTCQ